MSEFGDLELAAPDEGGGGGPEELSEEAKARFAAAAAAMQQIKREEKKSKKRDGQVAKTIIQFLSDEQHTHLFLLISRLVARDCPSIFVLSILSLINKDCLEVVQNYLKEVAAKTSEEAVDENISLTNKDELDAKTNRTLIEWITRMQMILSLDAEKILTKLMVDEKNVDGTVLQISTFVMQEFFESKKKKVPFERLQQLTAGILQTMFEPFITKAREQYLKEREKTEERE
jgi:hypothetical protein